MPLQPPPETFTDCPALTFVGDTTNDFDAGLAAHAGAVNADRAMAAVSATNAADILRMRSSLGEAADKGGRTRGPGKLASARTGLAGARWADPGRCYI